MTLEIYRGPSMLDGQPIVMLAGGMDSPSLNRKTGPVVQLWILRADVRPYEAVRARSDVSICGDCMHRGGSFTKRSCYVDLRHPTTVWLGERARGTPKDLSRRNVRFGAYGDPAAVPMEVISAIAAESKSWLGYTQFWAQDAVRPYHRLLMASVHSEREQAEAVRLGWRTFRNRAAGSPLLAGEIECPHTTHRAQCIDCRLCDGARDGDSRRHIAIEFHGTAVRQAERASRLRVIHEEYAIGVRVVCEAAAGDGAPCPAGAIRAAEGPTFCERHLARVQAGKEVTDKMGRTWTLEQLEAAKKKGDDHMRDEDENDAAMAKEKHELTEVEIRLREADAIPSVMRELAELPPNAASRVLEYVTRALGLQSTGREPEQRVPRQKHDVKQLITERGTVSPEEVAEHFGIRLTKAKRMLAGSANLGYLAALDGGRFGLNKVMNGKGQA